MGKLIDLTGQKFGMLTVVKRGNNFGRHSGWLCKCDCGNQDLVLIRGCSLIYGHTKSCGCIKKERTRKMGLNTKKHFGCTICGSDKHYAKGMCHNCYEKNRRQNMKYKNERKGA